MSAFEPGTYIIVPGIVADSDHGVGINPRIPPVHTPKDIPVGFVGRQLIDRWVITKDTGGNDAFTVFADTGRPSRASDYKWVVQPDNHLAASSTRRPDAFRFEPAGDGLWTIGLFGKDALLGIFDITAEFPFIFKPADGTISQRWKAVRVG